MSEKKDHETADQEQDDDDDDSVSMQDVLNAEQQIEEDANAVLGASDTQNCTYDQGYIDRQALYACGTCRTKDSVPAGLCLACSLECHEGHDLYELYTKRNFRCDCGNKKFIDNKCQLNPNKGDYNEDNKYSQNFRGLYCVCHRPYPDPEDQIPDEQIQCTICEDWYHGRHIGVEAPKADHDELICAQCMAKADFLYKYATLYPLMHTSTASKADLHITEDIDITKVTGAPAMATTNGSSGASNNNTDADSCSPPEAKKRKTDGCDGEKKRQEECKLDMLSAFSVDIRTEGATYWPASWREKLCTCDKCKKMYERLEVSFLTDTNDTIAEYEARGRARNGGESQTQYEAGLGALQNMNRMQQIEILTEFNSMKGELKDYLKKFAENKQMVTKEDIQEFFRQLQAKKRPNVSVPHFCK